MQQFCEKFTYSGYLEWGRILFFHFYAFTTNETNLKFYAPTLQRSNAPTNSEKVKRLVWGMAFVLLCGSFSIANAQQCDSQADFNFTFGVGCNVSFQPVNTNGSHFWTFETVGTGVPSASNHPNPIHTFGAFTSNLRRVTHTITISGVTYTCTKFFTLNCQEGCDDRVINYVVDGCVVKFWSAFTLLTWDFGDGAFSNLATPTHTYAATGTYTVTVTLASGQVCRKTITVNCESSGICCTPNFTAEIRRECSELYLSLSAECTTGGTHSWSFFPSIPGACMDMANFFQGMPMQGMIQLTNINTCEMTAIRVQHTYTCPNGVVLQQTQNIPINDPGIYIGINNTTTQLTDYNCVLPGASYTGGCTVYSTGYVDVDKSFTFSNSLVKMHPGESGFDVINHKDFTLNQNTEVSANTECPCLWRGIHVFNANMTTDTDASIQDALYAIRGGQKSKLFIRETLFARNFIGIRATEGLFSLNLFESNRFEGIGPLKEVCSLEPLKADIVAPVNAGSSPTNQPIDFVPYSSQRGFAGMYLEKCALNLGALPSASQNVFTDMAYGIMFYDCNVEIVRNSIFQNIAAGAYGYRRTGGVLFVDRPLQGPNTFLFTGNNQFHGGNIDFQNCTQGMQIRSEQSAAPTPISIANAKMSGVHAGIFLDARFGGGEFIGAAAVGKYVGVKNNHIVASLAGAVLIFNVGIALADYSPGASMVEISNNIVDLSYPQGLTAGGSTGIVAAGISGVSDPGPGVVEVDIFENRITLSNGAANGIGLTGHPNGWIRNNSGGDINSGNGIFVTSGQSWSGILSNLTSNNNLIACNEVTVLSDVVAGLLSVEGGQNSQYLRNSFTGPGNGAHFEGLCANTEFRCNDMTDNTIGLLYDSFAETGDQGTPTVTNGNRWVGTFTGNGAETDMSVNPTLSKYYYRGINNETPPSGIPTIGTIWFLAANSNATSNCLMDPCPALPPMAYAPLKLLTRLDTVIAEGQVVPLDSPYAEGREWQHSYNLLRKLKDNPALAEGNSLMQNFLSSLSGSNFERLWDVQMNIRNTIVPNANLLETVQSNLNTIQQIEAQIWSLDSLLGEVMDPNQQEVLSNQLSNQEALLESQLLEQEAVCGQVESQRTSAISELLTQLSSITPTNTCETNLRRTCQIYLQTVASNIEADSSLLAELESIAIQCPLEGGLGVSTAGLLFQGFTGVLPTQGSCNGTGERGKQTTSKTQGLSLYPNPNQGGFVVNIPEAFASPNSLLHILDARGSFVKGIAINGESTMILDMKGQPNGLYFLYLFGNSTITETLPFIIQH